MVRLPVGVRSVENSFNSTIKGSPGPRETITVDGFTTNSAPPPQLDNTFSSFSNTDEFTRDLPTGTTTDEEESMVVRSRFTEKNNG
ncbi:unnamed protein product [Phytophthora fragariaefolia]|uniref:Unnamed protein product n=1 Tax=Phytophthora fragariaefolia TaxID=1490495 RepID=A0A9W6THL3_9STRA|nr:unnamed protein product [Phytophthora fragariaefolia]